jgi:intein-encoded DNA endonuclease-like protein
MMLPVKEEEADDVSSFNADESAKRYKPSPPALGTVMVKTNIDQREQSAKQIQRVWRTVFKKCRSQIYAQSFLDVLTMDYVKSIRLVVYRICLFV